MIIEKHETFRHAEDRENRLNVSKKSPEDAAILLLFQHRRVAGCQRTPHQAVQGHAGPLAKCDDFGENRRRNGARSEHLSATYCDG